VEHVIFVVGRRFTMHVVRRKVADQREAELLLREWRSGHEKFPDFCADRGVDGRSLRCWRINLDRRHAPAVRLVEVTPRAVVAVRSTYRVIVGEMTVELDDAFREDTLARLLEVVGRC